MYSVYKNQHLQNEIKLNARLLNRCVDRALDKPTIDCFDHGTINRVCSQQPFIPVENIDVVRRPLAFGRWALPKLYKELHSKEKSVQLQAINSVCDLIKDPEKAFEAIRLKFVRRLGNLVIKVESNDFRERILLALNTFAGQSLGREEMATTPVIMKGLLKLLENKSFNIRCKTAAVIEMLARSFTVCCNLIEEDYVPEIVKYITVDKPEIVLLHLHTLEHLFTHAIGQEQGIMCDSFCKLIYILDSENNDIVAKAQNCLAMLTSHPVGKILAGQHELLLRLNEFLHSQNPDVYTAAAEVLMFATHTVAAKHDAADIDGLAVRLLDLSHDYNNPALQMFTMKALCNMIEHPKIRTEFATRLLDEVKTIRTCDNEELNRYKQILIKLIKWKPWIG